MLSLFNKKFAKHIKKSINKYNQILRDDINLIIRTRYKGKLYSSDIEYLYNFKFDNLSNGRRNEIYRFTLENKNTQAKKLEY